MKKQNKGEWSEFVTKLSILAHQSLRLVNVDNLEKTQCTVRSIQISNKMYLLVGKSIYETTYTKDGNKPTNRFVCFAHDIKAKLPSIYDKLKVGKRSFNIPEAEQLALKMGIDTVCDLSHNKGDITLTFLDDVGRPLPKHEAVSLKSFLGDNPSLLNASVQSTRIRFKIDAIDEDVLYSLHKENKKARPNMESLVKLGASFNEVHFSDTMENNLNQLKAKEELAFAVLSHFTKSDTKASTMDLLETMTEDKDSFNKAMKSVLRASLIGMNPSEYWDGLPKVSDNLLIALPDNSCEALVGKNTVESYLYNFCYIDTPSQSKHRYGKLYKKDNDWYIDLNFQIRLSNMLPINNA